ncbi:hypothetical protein F3Y22_tig00109924pilonHSYRG00092 [Hibiscus syriacus]|uniref:Uncharacterized protein n=1 Tax=Hibiscus syriacus TaxID=106335 RepID=A0A6A3BSX8_HIBSY|nr:hypothetical protein F3Y22_tig00109924pilonHSYRG00092 [Hibiscus syriacus]
MDPIFKRYDIAFLMLCKGIREKHHWDAAAVVEEYGLPCGKDEFLAELYPLFSARLCNIKPHPGANRLLKHLSGHGVPMALASNSSRENIESKISYHQGWRDYFSVIVGGDEVTAGTPSLKCEWHQFLIPESCYKAK